MGGTSGEEQVSHKCDIERVREGNFLFLNAQVHILYLCWGTIWHSDRHASLQLSVRVPGLGISILRVWGSRVSLVHLLGDPDTRWAGATS